MSPSEIKMRFQSYADVSREVTKLLTNTDVLNKDLIGFEKIDYKLNRLNPVSNEFIYDANCDYSNILYCYFSVEL